MKNDTFNQNASAGFIEIYTLQMRLAQEKERHALLTIGEERNKKAFLPIIKDLCDLGFSFFATEHTHEFLKKNKIESVLLHKMYKKEYPSLEDMLRQNMFDLIVNVPYDKQFPEAKADQEIIRKWAVKTDVPVVTNLETAMALLSKMKKRMVVRKKTHA